MERPERRTVGWPDRIAGGVAVAGLALVVLGLVTDQDTVAVIGALVVFVALTWFGLGW